MAVVVMEVVFVIAAGIAVRGGVAILVGVTILVLEKVGDGSGGCGRVRRGGGSVNVRGGNWGL